VLNVVQHEGSTRGTGRVDTRRQGIDPVGDLRGPFHGHHVPGAWVDHELRVRQFAGDLSWRATPKSAGPHHRRAPKRARFGTRPAHVVARARTGIRAADHRRRMAAPDLLRSGSQISLAWFCARTAATGNPGPWHGSSAAGPCVELASLRFTTGPHRASRPWPTAWAAECQVPGPPLDVATKATPETRSRPAPGASRPTP